MQYFFYIAGFSHYFWPCLNVFIRKANTDFSLVVSDTEYRSTTDRLSSFLFSSLPPFDLSRIKGISEECQRQSKIYVEDLKDFQMWALKSE